MQNDKSRVSKLAKVAGMSLLLGCGSSGWASKTTITVAAFPALDQIVKDALPEWSKENPDIEIKVVSREYADHHTAMTTALAASSGLPDVMAIEYGYLGRFASSGALEDLSAQPYGANEFSDKFVSFSWNQGFLEGVGQVAIPSDIGPGALFFRKDIFEAAGVDVNSATSSWSGFVAAGEAIKASTGGFMVAHARDVKDVIIRAGIPEGEGIYFDAAGKPVISKSPRFLKAFTVAKEIRDKGLDAKIGAWSNEWSEGLRRGNLATQMMGAWLGGHLKNWLAPDTAGKWRSHGLPEGVEMSWGGSFFAIPNKAENKDAAWRFIKFLTTSEHMQSRAFANHDAFPSLLAAQQGAFFEEPIEFLGGQVARTSWAKTAQAIRATKVFKHDAVAEEIVNSELDLVLVRGKDIQEAIDDAQRAVARRARR